MLLAREISRVDIIYVSYILNLIYVTLLACLSFCFPLIWLIITFSHSL